MKRRRSLEQLVARGFLVTRSGRRSYTVHPLVRAYAERQAWGSDEGAAAISRAAAHLERTGEHHRAASLYLRAGRFDDAARPLRALALSSLNAVVDFAHDGWADLLPGDDDAVRGRLAARRQGPHAAAADEVRDRRPPSTSGPPACWPPAGTTRGSCRSCSARCSVSSTRGCGKRAWP